MTYHIISTLLSCIGICIVSLILTIGARLISGLLLNMIVGFYGYIMYFDTPTMSELLEV